MFIFVLQYPFGLLYFIFLLSQFYLRLLSLDSCGNNIRRIKGSSAGLNQDEFKWGKPEQTSIPGPSNKVFREMFVQEESNRDQNLISRSSSHVFIQKDSKKEMPGSSHDVVMQENSEGILG